MALHVPTVGAQGKSTKLAGWYFVVQGMGIVVWWLLIWLLAPVRDMFLQADRATGLMKTLFIADLFALAFVSILAGALFLRRRKAGNGAAFVVFGAMLYATLITVGMAWAGWVTNISLLTMLLSCAATTFACRVVTRSASA